MIYRTDGERGEVHQPLDWKLFSIDRRRIPVNSEEQLREYLRRHPDEDFWLIPGPFMNREIQGVDAAHFDPQGEHIRCGIVHFDSRKGKAVTRDRMKVDYSDKVKQWNGGFALLQQATKRLEEVVVGPSAPWILVEWDQKEDAKGRPVFTLRISDWTGEISATFAPDELRSLSQDRYRWRELWGDLLQLRSHKQLEAVGQAPGPAELTGAAGN